MKIKLFELNNRLAGGKLPTVYIEDLREELKQGNRSIFSRRLKELLQDRMQKGQQSMLFLNRRGFAGFVSCRACGHVMKCPHCDVSLSEHNNGKLVCHYCGYETPQVTKCPQCGSKYILGFRAGTQQIEEMLLKEFPQARVLRMDADTTKSKDSYEKILSQFANEEADILVGTQMIVKGHDFPKVTLVGVIAADMSLHVGDYRAAERTFQLLTQAAGRAGRSTLPGEVVIQTYQPDHYAVVHAANQDYEGFFEEEIAYRDLMMYPPVANMMAILVLSNDELTGMVHANELADAMKRQFTKERLYVIGPTAASIGKINDILDGQGINKNIKANSNAEAINKLTDIMDKSFTGLCMVNLADFDSLYGHTRDIEGYARAIEELDVENPFFSSLFLTDSTPFMQFA